MYQISIKNIVTNEQFYWSSDEKTITYEYMVENIQEYEPQSNMNSISLRYLNTQKNLWLYFTRNTVIEVPEESEIDFRYKFHGGYTLPDKTKQQVDKLVDEAAEKKEEFKRRFDGETIDINLFWANPIMTSQKRNKYHSLHDICKGQDFLHHYPLKTSVQYQEYFHTIIECLRKHEKRVHVKIKEFNEKSFQRKTAFSIAYLICHAEQKTNKQVDLANELSRTSSLEQQTKKVHRSALQTFHKQSSETQMEKSVKTESGKIEQELSSPKLKSIKSDHESKVTSKTERDELNEKYLTYFVGESFDGELVQISPATLREMLEGKNIKLLILHTSYPFAHYDLLHKTFDNAILINSNPLYPEQVTKTFLSLFFQKILLGFTIQQAYDETMKVLKVDYQKEFSCCCYHEHTEGCQSSKGYQSRFEGYHYRTHVVRCQCQKSHQLKHKCPDKLRQAKKQYKHSIQNDKKEHYVCCCQSEKDHQKYHGIQNKFAFNLRHEGTDIHFDFRAGEIKGDAPYLRAFQREQKLIGNKKVIIIALKKFIHRQPNESFIFNIYGNKQSGKTTLTNRICDILLQKKIFTQIVKKKFKKFEDIQFEQNEKILYVLFFEPSKKDYHFSRLVKDQLPNYPISALLVTSKQIILQFSRYQNSYSIEPFNSEDCRNFLKSYVHLTQNMKDKTKTFFDQFAWRHEWKEKYYPLLFDIPELLSTIASSPYKGDYLKYVCAFKEIVDGVDTDISDEDLVDFFLFMGLTIVLPKGQRQYCSQYFNSVKAYNRKQVKILINTKQRKQKKSRKDEKKEGKQRNNHEKEKKQPKYESINRSQILNLRQNLDKFFPIFYQMYCTRHKAFIELLQVYVQFTYKAQSEISLFDATTDDRGSLLSIFFGKQYKRCLHKKMENKELFLFIQCYKKRHPNFLLKAALELVRKIFCSFYLYDMQERDEKINLIKLCLFIINNAIIQRKTEDYSELGSDIDSNQSSVKTFSESLSPVKNARRKSISSLKSQSAEKSEKHLSQSIISLKSDLDYFEEKPAKRGRSISREIKNKKTSIKVQEKVKNNTMKRKGEEDLIINQNLLSKQGLLYLLQKIKNKDIEDYRFEAIINQLILQLQLEDVFESDAEEEKWLKIQKRINILFQILKNDKKTKTKEESVKNGRNRLNYDLWIVMILQFTRCGRYKLTSENLSQILCRISIPDQKNNSKPPRKLSAPFFKKKRYERVILKMCANNQVYNKMSQKISFNRFQSEHYTDDCESQMECFEKIIDFWERFNQEKVFQTVQSTRKYYETIIFLYKKLPEFKKNISNTYLLKLFKHLQVSVRNMLFRLRNRLLIFFVATPISDKKHKMQNKFLVNFSQILKKVQNKTQNQNLEKSFCYSEKKLSTSVKSNLTSNFDVTEIEENKSQIKLFFIEMKLNHENLRKLREQEGCRYIAFSVHTEKINSKLKIFGENSFGIMEQFTEMQLCEELKYISFVYLFLCQPKEDLALIMQKQVRKLFQMIYFDFSSFVKIPKPEKRIMMTYFIKKVIDFMEAGEEISTAYHKVINSLQICYPQEYYDLNKINIFKETARICTYENEPLDEQKPVSKTLQVIKSSLTIKEDMLEVIEKIADVLQGDFRKKPRVMAVPDLFLFWPSFQYYMQKQRGVSEYFTIDSDKKQLFKNFSGQILRAYYSTKKLLIIFQNYDLNKYDRWVHDQFDKLFDTDGYKFSTGLKIIKRGVKKGLIEFKNQHCVIFICLIETIEQISIELLLQE